MVLFSFSRKRLPQTEKADCDHQLILTFTSLNSSQSMLVETAAKSVAFYTLGCKLNFSETITIASSFEQEGFYKACFEQKADIYVFNTCSVTENADKRFKSIVKKPQKVNEDAFVIAVGCYAQLQPGELADVDGLDLALGATEKFKVTDYLQQLSKEQPTQVYTCEIDAADFYVGSYSIGDRTRAFLKVQDGCDYKCTYCTIPLARVISCSDTLENVMENARQTSGQGIKEVVLT
jgi:threonylcarbamoyladenosine tRNA methylthiotransferase MtaB